MSSMNVPSGVSNPEYCACPTLSFAASLHEIRRTAASASLAAISISPMWLTSKMPARVRTAMCSLVIPAYSTDISQPAYGIIRPFRARWRALSGVFRSSAAVEADTRKTLNDSIRRMAHLATDLAVTLPEDRPGMLAKAIGAVGGAGINIDGYAEMDGVVHVLTTDLAAARKVLDQSGFRVVTEQQVVLIPIEDQPGAAARVFQK